MQLYIHALKRHYKTLRLYSHVDFEHNKTQTKKVICVLCELVSPGYFFKIYKIAEGNCAGVL